MLKTVSALAMTLALTGLTGVNFAHAEDGEVVAGAKEAGRDVKKGAKKAGRAVKDATCEMINGKMECAAKEAGNKLKNAGDEIKDKAQ